ncbi:MAG: DUF192 domain-containing protein [Treponemataceae bacterium]|nr:DUF192 domain-containing protein [Treponemataceae bacterium]
MNRRFFAFLVISVIFVLFSCGQKKLQTKDLTIKKSSGETVVVKAELAITEEQQTYGFMNRKNIPDGTGMLFIFKDDRIASFWMKNTPTPLSIAYIDYSGKIKDIFDMTPFSLASIVSTGYVRYALEVPQGWFSKNGIVVGDVLDLSPLKN